MGDPLPNVNYVPLAQLVWSFAISTLMTPNCICYQTPPRQCPGKSGWRVGSCGGVIEKQQDEIESNKDVSSVSGRGTFGWGHRHTAVVRVPLTLAQSVRHLGVTFGCLLLKYGGTGHKYCKAGVFPSTPSTTTSPFPAALVVTTSYLQK